MKILIQYLQTDHLKWHTSIQFCIILVFDLVVMILVFRRFPQIESLNDLFRPDIKSVFLLGHIYYIMYVYFAFSKH